jgi:hypothetical protein
MERLRVLSAAVLSLGLMCSVWGAATPTVTPLGTVIAADRTPVGEDIAGVGTTVYGGASTQTCKEVCRCVRAQRAYCF